MTREAFVALVERLRPMADARPATYRWRVRGFALLGYGFIFLLLFGSLALVGLLVGLLVVSHRAAAIVLKGGWVLLLFVWKILKSLWVKFERPTGRELSRAEAPALYAAVDRLTKGLRAPRFHHILLTTDFNASVQQQPRLGVLGWPRNFLQVGLPLLQSLSPEHAEAVIAHELGHLRGGHGRFGAWIYRVNATWEQLLGQLEGQDTWVAKFFDWYAPRFSAWSLGIRRPAELEADAAAAGVTGAQVLADALCAITLRDATLDELHWEPLLAGVATNPVAPADTFSRLLPVAKTMRLPADREADILTRALSVETDGFDTHPSLRDRLAALGQAARVPPLPTVTAAEAWLGDQLPDLVAHYDEKWRDAQQDVWTERHTDLVRQRARLADLADRYARQRALTPEERWELADLTEDHESSEAALPLFRALFNEPSQEPAARYAVGRILLAQDDPAGLALLDDVMAREPDARASGLLLLEAYHTRVGNRDAAARLAARQIEHADQADAAAAERNVLSKANTYLPHGLPPDGEALAALRRGLADFRADVAGAWLFRKQLEHFPEKPLYVLIVELTPATRKRVDKNDETPAVVNSLVRHLDRPGEMFVVPLTNDNAWLAERARQLPDTRIYSASDVPQVVS